MGTLTNSERETLLWLESDRLRKKRETMVADERGNVRVVHRSDSQPVVDAVKAYSEMGTRRTKAGTRYLGSVDPILATVWARECGAAVGTKEFAAYAKKKLLSGNYTKLRAEITNGKYFRGATWNTTRSRNT